MGDEMIKDMCMAVLCVAMFIFGYKINSPEAAYSKGYIKGSQFMYQELEKRGMIKH